MTATDWAARDAALFRLRSVVAVPTSIGCEREKDHLTLQYVLRLIDRPMQLWVENDRNDRNFWLAMMSDDQRSMFLDLEKRRLVEFSSRGGLDELRASLAAQIERGASSAHDSWVLFDSDGQVPGHRSASASAMVKFCLTAGLAYHCLARRAIENYLPGKALWQWADGAGSDRRPRRRNLVESYLRMSDPQRHHYHLKSGWLTPEPAEVTALYASVSQLDKTRLRAGVSNSIASLYETHLSVIRQWLDKEGMDTCVKTTLELISNWIRVPYA